MISYLTTKGRSNLRICEDSLTAAIFDGLKYLPTEFFYEILTKSLYINKLPKNPGELQNILFWEKWDANKTRNSTYVEPDLLLQFDEFDIIIEAKRYDNFQQSKYQMENEIKSYFNTFEDDKDLFFMQLGGLHSKQDELDYDFDNKKIKIIKTDWTRLLHEVVNKRNTLKLASFSLTNAYCRILDDVRKAFEIHNFYEMKWLNEIANTTIKIDRINEMKILK